MIKSELIERISSQNPHLFERVIEKVVNAILDEMVEALRRGDRDELRGSEPFRLGSEKHARRATPVLVLPSRSQRELSLLQDRKGDARAA
jgi:nucleoid DNA-binding protein